MYDNSVNIKGIKELKLGDVLFLGGNEWEFHSFKDGNVIFSFEDRTLSFTEEETKDLIKKAMVSRPVFTRIRIDETAYSARTPGFD